MGIGVGGVWSINAGGGGGGTVMSVNSINPLYTDNTDAANPVLSIESNPTEVAYYDLANTGVQPGTGNLTSDDDFTRHPTTHETLIASGTVGGSRAYMYLDPNGGGIQEGATGVVGTYTMIATQAQAQFGYHGLLPSSTYASVTMNAVGLSLGSDDGAGTAIFHTWPHEYGSPGQVLQTPGSPIAPATTSLMTWTSVLTDNAAVDSIDYQQRFLYDAAGVVSVEYTGRAMLTSGAVTVVDWENADLFDTAFVQSANWSTRNLHDDAGTNNFSWRTRPTVKTGYDLGVEDAGVGPAATVVAVNTTRYYGSNNGVLTTPDAWMRVNIAGTDYVMPAYTP